MKRRAFVGIIGGACASALIGSPAAGTNGENLD